MWKLEQHSDAAVLADEGGSGAVDDLRQLRLKAGGVRSHGGFSVRKENASGQGDVDLGWVALEKGIAVYLVGLKGRGNSRGETEGLTVKEVRHLHLESDGKSAGGALGSWMVIVGSAWASEQCGKLQVVVHVPDDVDDEEVIWPDQGANPVVEIAPPQSAGGQPTQLTEMVMGTLRTLGTKATESAESADICCLIT